MGKQSFSLPVLCRVSLLQQKSSFAPILMVEVDRDNIQTGLDFFCSNFDGDNPLSPSNIPYLFVTLYQNQLTDSERFHIIQDIKHHIGKTKLVHICGLQDIDVLVSLKQNIAIRLRKLLLSIKAQNTNTRLFTQIEKDANPDALLCAYDAVDHDIIVTNLPHLSLYIRQCLIETDYTRVFTNADFSITIGTKSFPVKKGSYQVSSRPIPITIQEHTNVVLCKMIQVPMK